MKKSFLYIFACIIIIIGPKAFADTITNSDFDPFPQMEQDMNNTDDQAVPATQHQNDDWPPASNGAPTNTDGVHD